METINDAEPDPEPLHEYTYPEVREIPRILWACDPDTFAKFPRPRVKSPPPQYAYYRRPPNL